MKGLELNSRKRYIRGVWDHSFETAMKMVSDIINVILTLQGHRRFFNRLQTSVDKPN